MRFNVTIVPNNYHIQCIKIRLCNKQVNYQRILKLNYVATHTILELHNACINNNR